MSDSLAEQSTEPSADSPPSEALPLVTVLMPIYNEGPFIGRGIEQVLAQDYPSDRVEIIIVDGMSTDDTRDIVLDYQRRYPQIQLVDNPRRFRASGLNVGIAMARGEVIICIDGHCEVATDFIRQDVRLFEEHPECWCVGGPIVHSGTNAFSKAVAVAMSHPCGVGGATHRFANYEGYAEGAAYAAFRRWVFDRIGLFDEVMVRTEDDELNFRMSQAGGKTWLSPRVRYKYYVRDTPRKLYQQYVQYSFWRIPVMRKHKRPTTVRQVMPPLFFLAMLALLIAGLMTNQPLVAFGLPVVYLGTLAAVGIVSIPKVGFKVACLVPVAIGIMHVAYAWGLIRGLFAALFWPKAFDPSGGMSQQRR